ncbi:MAG: sugar phosphate isomerase [Candidatus Poribacteria bacterium]|nr:MAG: sugar phosphate isomerase [Candidatus Poribacteria bacterium]
MAHIPVGLQTYTVREDLTRDFVGTLRRVAEIGYEGVEGLPGGGLSPREYRQLLEQLNLKTPGGHVPLEQLESDLNRVVELSQEIGARFVTIPYLAEPRRRSADDWRRLGEIMTRIGERLAQHSLVLCYHNHSFEFQRFEGKYGLDLLYESSDPRYLQAELDTYWIQHGGEDPAEYIRKYAGRVPLLHIKDMAADGDFAEIGEGVLDWPRIFDAAEAAGVQWYLVEQDRCSRRTPLEAIALSLDNLRKMGKVAR